MFLMDKVVLCTPVYFVLKRKYEYCLKIQGYFQDIFERLKAEAWIQSRT